MRIIVIIGLATIYSLAPFLFTPRYPGRRTSVPITHLLFCMMMAYTTVRGYESQSTLMLWGPPALMVLTCIYAFWVTRSEWADKASALSRRRGDADIVDRVDTKIDTREVPPGQNAAVLEEKDNSR